MVRKRKKLILFLQQIQHVLDEKKIKYDKNDLMCFDLSIGKPFCEDQVYTFLVSSFNTKDNLSFFNNPLFIKYFVTSRINETSYSVINVDLIVDENTQIEKLNN
jgi:hypothetical protein